MVQLLDSTLREGEQTPGVCFSLQEKVEIAALLDTFGVSIIEAGHPAVSSQIRDSVKAIAGLGLNAEVLAHSRAQKSDIDLALQCNVEWVGIFFCVSDRSLEERFRMDPEAAAGRIGDCIEYAKDHGLKVRYTPEDTVRSEFENVVYAARAAIEAGVDRISIADTVGVMTPSRMHTFVTRLKRYVKVPLHIHCHNDLGMATANSLAAFEAGVEVIDVSVNGLGERTGIAPLAETALALRLLYNVENPWDISQLPELSRIVEEYSGIPISRQAPVVGENAFTHNAGLHVSAVLKDPRHYESIPVELVGRKRRFALNRMSGMDTVREKMREWDISLTEDQGRQLLEHVKHQNQRDLSDGHLLSFAKQIGVEPTL